MISLIVQRLDLHSVQIFFSIFSKRNIRYKLR